MSDESTPEHATPDRAAMADYYDVWFRKVRERSQSHGYSASDEYNEGAKSRIVREAIQRSIHRNEPTAWLDYGCGPAYLFGEFDVPADCRCVGIDVSREIIALDREKYADRPNLEFHDLGERFFEDMKTGSLDLITMIEVIEHVFDAELIVRRFWELLKPGGHLVITTPNRVRVATLLRRLVPRRAYLYLEDREAVRGIDELEETDEELASFGIKTHAHEFSRRELKALARRCGFTVEHSHGLALKVMPNRAFNALARRWERFPRIMVELDYATRSWPIGFFKTGMALIAVK